MNGNLPGRITGLLFSLISLAHLVSGQSTLTGVVRDSSGAALQGVSVWVEKDSAMLDFSITNVKGAFRLLLPDPQQDSLLLRVRALNFAPFLFLLNKGAAIPEVITLNPQPTQLREVIVESPSPIRKVGDTLSYSVEKFADKKDRAISDILRKLPGIEVEDNGRILFEGKPIQKFYIEGLDLLDGRYNLATNNLPYQEVKDVQIIPNHQPIRMLDSLVLSERASLNIKLKNKVAFTGQAKAAAGLPMPLYLFNTTPILFSRRQQIITSLQFNNIGQEIANDIKNLTADDFRNTQQRPEMLSIPFQASTQLRSNRVLFNRSVLGSFNYLYKVDTQTQLRITGDYLSDRREQNGSTQTAFYTPTDTIRLSEQRHLSSQREEFNTGLSLTRNAKTSFFENAFNLKVQSENAGGTLNGKSQELSGRFENWSNRLKWILLVRRNVVSLTANLFYLRSPQSLRFGSVGEAATIQDQYFRNFHYDAGVNFIRKAGLWTFSQTFGLASERQLFTSVSPGQDSIGRNDLPSIRNSISSTTDISLKKERYYLLFKIPLSYWNIKNQTDEHTLWRFIPKPTISLRYNLSDWVDYRISLAGNNSFSDAYQLNQQAVYTDYRTLRSNEVALKSTYTALISTGLNYSNTLTATMTGINYRYSQSRNNYVISSSVSPAGIQYFQYLSGENRSISHNGSFRYSKYITDSKTNLALSIDQNWNRVNQTINDLPADLSNRQQVYQLTAANKLLSFLSIELDNKVTLQQIKVNQEQTGRTVALNSRAGVHLFPAKRHYAGILAEWYSLRSASQNSSNFFLDMVYRYSRPRPQIDLEIRCDNLLDQRGMNTISNSVNSFSNTCYVVRPRQISIAITFPF